MAQSHAALRAMHACQVEEECAVPSERLFSPHPGPLPWGEGESFSALVSDRIALYSRKAAIADGASEATGWPPGSSADESLWSGYPGTGTTRWSPRHWSIRCSRRSG